MSLKIGFDAKRLFNNFTGLGNYSRTLVKNLQKFYPDNEYHLFTPSVVENEETAFFLTDKFQIHRPSGFKTAWRTFYIPKLVKEYKLDIYHGLSHEIPLTRLPNTCKSIVSFHDLIYEIYPKQFTFFDRWLYKLKYKRSALLADHVVAISKSTESDLRALYNASNNSTHVIYQASNKYFKTPEKELKLADRKFFLFVGSIIERKGVDKLVEVYKKFGDELPPLYVIGSGGKFKKQLIEEVEKSNIENEVKFIHQISNKELLEFYQKAIATILPSVYEGFGIPVIESLRCGTPVITSNVSSLPEACGEGGLLCDPLDIHSIYEKMIKIRKEETWQRLVIKGIDHVNKNFNEELVSKQLMSLYQL